MHDTAAELAQRGKRLPRDQRERLVDELLESLTDSCKSVGSMIESLVLKHG